MAAADYPWLPLEDVLAHLGVPAGSANADVAEAARVAAAAYVQKLRPDLIGPQGYVADDAVRHGAVLVAARLYARRGSPVGVASFGEFGASVPRLDPDAERLLGVGRYAGPQVG